MKPIHLLVVPGLLLGSVVAFAQRSRAVPTPSLGKRMAFDAPRLLTDLTEGTPNGGVVLTGDVDNDGDVDLLAVEHANSGNSPQALQVWLNGGPVEFVHAHTLTYMVRFYTGPFSYFLRYPRDFFLADVTADGVLDVLSVRDGIGDQINFPPDGMPPYVVVYPGIGDGSFGGELLIPGTLGDSSSQVSFAVGDCDGDGDSDVFVRSTEDGSLAWWHYEGESFVSGAALVGVPTNHALATLDIDGDGIAGVVGFSPTRDSVLIFRTVNGVPVLDTEIPLSEPSYVSMPFVGDLDGDGDDDVLAVKSINPPNPPQTLFQPILNSAAGFAPGPLQSVQVVANPSDGRLADWDEDGDADYVGAAFIWRENTGAGTFVAGGTVQGVTLSQERVQVADVDGDGHLDVSLDRNCYFGDGTFPRRNSTGDEPGHFQGGQPPSSFNAVEDWEGDGDLDFATSDELHLNKGDGRFVERPTGLPFLSYPHDHYSVVGWGDFDGDGFRDIVAASLSFSNAFLRMALFTGTESGAYVLSPTEPSPIRMTVTDSLAGDLDGDGDLDILSRDGFWQNDGLGQFGTSLVAAYTGRPLNVIDLDGDGDLDMLVHEGTGTSMRWLENLGGLSFQDTVIGTSGSKASFLDVDEDGDLDLVMTYPSSDLVQIYEQLPGGDLAAPLELAMPGADGPAGQVDVDRDGRLDLVVAGRLDGQSTVWLLSAWVRGPGSSFSERRDWMTLSTVAPLGFADVDRDGDVDPLWFSPTGLHVFENLRFDGAVDGSALQYGLDAATSGTGGIHPVLGTGGPARPGHWAEFVIGRGRGGALGVLLAGDARTDVLDGGIRRLVDGPTVPRTFVLDGPPGAAGKGSLVLQVPMIPALIGRMRDFQVVLVDPGASSGFSATNGLEVRFGNDRPSE